VRVGVGIEQVNIDSLINLSTNRNPTVNNQDLEYYESQFDPMNSDRQARRKRKPKAKHTPKRTQQEILEEMVENVAGLEGGFQTTYQPSIYEAEWLLSSLQTFFDQELITDILGLVKGGKEASVYRCEASPVTNEELLAAKVYRPHKFRQFRNDAAYREGRQVLTAAGRAVKANEHRILRAIGKKTGFGRQVSHTSWLMQRHFDELLGR
jgi:RIO kinase 1